MNKIEQQFKKQEKKQNSSLLKWWRKNNYKVMRILFFYIWLPSAALEKIKENKYKNLAYSDELSKKYLDKVLPKLAARYEEDPNLMLFHDTSDFGGIHIYWDLCSSWMKKKFRKEVQYFTKFNLQLKEFIIEKYLIDGYQKMVLNNWIAWEKAKEKFDWGGTPYSQDYAIGIVFYKEQIDEEY